MAMRGIAFSIPILIAILGVMIVVGWYISEQTLGVPGLLSVEKAPQTESIQKMEDAKNLMFIS